jgi:Uma2 family endonuclease
MAEAEATVPITTEQLLAMPEDGVERWLIQGQLREKPMTVGQLQGKSMTVHNRAHSHVMAQVARHLGNWVERQPEPHGEVLCGEAGVQLSRDPATTVRIDVAYFSSEVAAQRPQDTTLIEGAPVLAVEILSPNDTVKEINEKIDAYLTAGVALVWVIDPYRRTVKVIRPGTESEMANAGQELSGEPELPGFRVRMAQLFF